MCCFEDDWVSADPQLQHNLAVSAEHGEDTALVSLRTLQLHQQTELICKSLQKHPDTQHLAILLLLKTRGAFTIIWTLCKKWMHTFFIFIHVVCSKCQWARVKQEVKIKAYPSVRRRWRGADKVEYCPTCRTRHLLSSEVTEVLLLLSSWRESSCRRFTSSVVTQNREKCWSPEEAC